jgi:hypothetical protein
MVSEGPLMPSFEFTSPEGKSYTVQGPEGATPEQAFSMLQQHLGSQSPQGGENSLGGSLKSIGSGLINGGIGMAGLPGDTNAAIHSALPQAPAPNPAPPGMYGSLVSALERLRSGAELPTSGDIRGAIESKTGSLDYQPQTALEHGLKTTAEFAPAALSPGSALRKAGQVAIPALASEGAGKLTEGTAAEPYARTAAAVTGSILAHKATTPNPKVSTPNSAQVVEAGSAGYKDPAIDAVKFKATAIPDLADDIVSTLNRDKRNAKLVPAVHTIVEDMKNPVNGQVHTIEDLETTRRLLQEKAQNFTDKTEQGAATLAIKKIDNYLKGNPQSDVLIGDIKAANDALSTARQNTAIGKTAQRIEDKIRAGEVGAGSTHSGKNVENQLRQKLRPILTNKKQAQNLTDENLADVEQMVMGSPAGNTLRTIGNMFGGGGGIATPVAAGIGHALGGPAGAVAAPVLGLGMRMAGNARARSHAQNIVNGILARSPEAQQWAAMQQRISAANPAPRALPAGIGAALLSLQRLGQGQPIAPTPLGLPQ